VIPNAKVLVNYYDGLTDISIVIRGTGLSIALYECVDANGQ
jgi:hypothetical protein